MSGIGYRKHPVKATINVVTGSRVLDTIYQNTSGRPILCLVSLLCIRIADGETAFAIAQVENATPPTIDVSSAGLRIGALTESPEIADFNLIFAVPNGNYYKITTYKSGTSDIAITYWTEVQL